MAYLIDFSFSPSFGVSSSILSMVLYRTATYVN